MKKAVHDNARNLLLVICLVAATAIIENGVVKGFEVEANGNKRMLKKVK